MHIPSGMQKGYNFNELMTDCSVNGISEIMGNVLSGIDGGAIMNIGFNSISGSKINQKNRES